jgi:hypothetical protein
MEIEHLEEKLVEAESVQRSIEAVNSNVMSNFNSVEDESFQESH